MTREASKVTELEPAAIGGSRTKDVRPDWEIVGAHHVRLRAERMGKGNARLYTITCTDASGNSSSETVTVAVPRDQR